MSRTLNILLICLFFALLALVRWFENDLFYDPLLHFFKANATKAALPNMDIAKLLLNLSFRFVLNSVLSLTILWFWFKDRSVIKMSLIIYVVVFLLGLVLYYIAIQDTTSGAHLFLFYVRRFLIQPLLLLLLIPAFYFQQKNN